MSDIYVSPEFQEANRWYDSLEYHGDEATYVDNAMESLMEAGKTGAEAMIMLWKQAKAEKVN